MLNGTPPTSASHWLASIRQYTSAKASCSVGHTQRPDSHPHPLDREGILITVLNYTEWNCMHILLAVFLDSWGEEAGMLDIHLKKHCHYDGSSMKVQAENTSQTCIK